MAGGSTVEEQVASGDGISDIVVETSSTVYIIELKMDQNVDADKYLHDEKYKES